jgi:hypothetical protein
MPKTCLTKDQIIELLGLLKNVFRYLEDLRVEHPLAKKIQYPKLPPSLSESIVFHLIKEKRILSSNIVSVDFGGRESDLTAIAEPLRVLKIEVKSTGENAFEYFGEKDIKADFLVWVHFSSFFHGNKQSFEIHVIEKPAKYFKEPVKITLSRLKETVGEDMKTLALSVDDL